MTSPIDDQWDFINPPTSTQPTTMATPVEQPPAPAATEPKIEVTINPKPVSKDPEVPPLTRQNSTDSALTSDAEEEVIRPRPARRARRNSFSPVRINTRYPPPAITPLLSSSTQLLENVGYDGIADMPYPGRNSIYLSTFPFTQRDVKKWAWLFAHGVEDAWLTTVEKYGRGEEDIVDDFDDGWCDNNRVVHVGRSRRREFDANYIDMSSVYLSRALDTTVIPEDTTEKVTYLMVVKNRNGTASSVKLLTAESRKAAGIMLYYEALIGNSIVFVGATVGDIGKKTKKAKKAQKFKKVDSLDEAKVSSEGGVVGVIC